MIGRLSGVLADKNPPQVLLDCNGVGYEVDVPMSTFYNLPGLGEKVTLLTHFIVREDGKPYANPDRLGRAIESWIRAAGVYKTKAVKGRGQ